MISVLGAEKLSLVEIEAFFWGSESVRLVTVWLKPLRPNFWSGAGGDHLLHSTFVAFSTRISSVNL
jgi:hypothetical protein